MIIRNLVDMLEHQQNNKSKHKIKITAPINNISEFSDLIKTGADELYFGFKIYDVQLGSIRGNSRSSFESFEEVFELINLAESKGIELFLTVNKFIHFSDEVIKIVNILKKLKKIGIKNIIVSDMFFLHIGKELGFNIIISSLMGVKNRGAAEFFSKFDVKRIILDRQVTENDVISIKNNIQNVELEAFAVNGMCRNINRLCRYRLLAKNNHKGMHTIWFKFSVSPLYNSNKNKKFNDIINERMLKKLRGSTYTGCGVCAFYFFNKQKIHSVKITGRGNCIDNKIKDISLVKKSLDLLNGCKSEQKYISMCKKLCNQIEGYNCQRDSCYYPYFSKINETWNK